MTSSIFFSQVMVLLLLAVCTAPARADAERSNADAVIGHINADYAYRIGITGKGVTVAVLDSGIASAHSEFAPAGKLAPGFDATDGSGNTTDGYGHGTHVAGILGAARDGRGMFGVAYDARLLPVKVLPDSGHGSTAMLDAGLRYAIGRAAIANMSLGSDTVYDPATLQQAVRAGLLLVVAAGNAGAASPAWPARFAREAWANGQIIAVGAVDGANRLAAFSNRAGDTAAWFLVAPGVDVLSSYTGGGYASMSGTSMAAPVVSGAAALLKQRWPALRADQIAAILFVTATDLGVPGIDPVYGRGLLNVEKALQPIGPLTTTTFDGRTIPVLAGATQLSSATSKLWSLAASGQLQLIGLDAYRRDFPVDLGRTIVRPVALPLQQVFASIDRRLGVTEQVLPDGARMAVAYERGSALSAALTDADSSAHDVRLAAFSLLTKDVGGVEAAFGVGGQEARYFGAGGLAVGHGLEFGAVDALANPYFTLIPQASHLALGRRIGGVKLKFGVLTSGFGQLFDSQDVCLPSSLFGSPKANAALFELSTSFDNAALSLGLSRTSESNAYLGAQSRGALSLGDQASTSAVHIAGAVLLRPKLALAGQASYGITPASQDRIGLVTDMTTARTNAFAVALVASDRFRPGDRFSLSLSQPLRTYSGQMAIDMLTGLRSDGSPAREQLRFSMEPTGRELRAQLNYRTPAGRNATLAATFLLRRQPGNLRQQPSESLLALRYMKSF